MARGVSGLALVFVWIVHCGKSLIPIFQDFSSSIDGGFILAGDWALGYYSMYIRQFSDIS